MPESWRDVAKDNRVAAHELQTAKRWRSTTSRAYYAAYAEVTHALLAAGAPMPSSQNNPKHGTLPTLIVNNLGLIGIGKRHRLSGVVDRLYKLRVIADYLPASTLDAAESRVAIGLMTQVFVLLKGIP